MNRNRKIENEIEMIDEDLFKISKLLMLCYGEAGSILVSNLIKDDILAKSDLMTS